MKAILREEQHALLGGGGVGKINGMLKRCKKR
jgi:hypothetical protein